MRVPTVQNTIARAEDFANRCRDLGLAVWRIEDGCVTCRPDPACCGHAWLLAPSIERCVLKAVTEGTLQNNGDSLFVGCDILCFTASRAMSGPIHALIFPQGAAAQAQEFHTACLEMHFTHAEKTAAIQRLGMCEHVHTALKRALRWLHEDSLLTNNTTQTLNEFSDRLIQAYEETNMLFRLAGFLNEASEPEQLMAKFARELHRILPFRWVAIQFAGNSQVAELAGRLVLSGAPSCDHVEFTNCLARAGKQAKGNDGLCILLPARDELARCTAAEVVLHAIVHDEQVIGVLAAGNKAVEDAELSSFETQFIEACAHLLGVFHENAARHAEQRAMFLGTLNALTASIDAKDPYTRGHSERVAQLAVQMAERLNLPTTQMKTFRIAGMVHDVGKIGIPEDILRKPGRLTDAEFKVMQQHPVIGQGILAGIPGFDSINLGVLHHHERWDGTGYPKRLRGAEIPLVARVLALADSFDAMSSNRAYRPAMPRNRVLEEVQRCAGTQFDPELAPLFVTLDFAAFDELMARAGLRQLAA